MLMLMLIDIQCIWLCYVIMGSHYVIAPNLIKLTLCDNSTDSNSPGAHTNTQRERGRENHPAYTRIRTNLPHPNEMKTLQLCLQRIIWQKHMNLEIIMNILEELYSPQLFYVPSRLPY